MLLLAPPIPLIFFGEEVGAREPFLYFCDHADDKLADAVREGRRNEFAKFPAFRDPAKRARDSRSQCAGDVRALAAAPRRRRRMARVYKELLDLRRAHIVPRLEGLRGDGRRGRRRRKRCARRWRMGDGARLTIVANLGR